MSPTSSPGISSPSKKKVFPIVLREMYQGLSPVSDIENDPFPLGKKYLYKSLITLERRKCREGPYTFTWKKNVRAQNQALGSHCSVHGDLAPFEHSLQTVVFRGSALLRGLWETSVQLFICAQNLRPQHQFSDTFSAICKSCLSSPFPTFFSGFYLFIF